MYGNFKDSNYKIILMLNMQNVSVFLHFASQLVPYLFHNIEASTAEVIKLYVKCYRRVFRLLLKCCIMPFLNIAASNYWSLQKQNAIVF